MHVTCGHFPMIDDPAAFCAAIVKGFALKR